jgi:hypothetical protein
MEKHVNGLEWRDVNRLAASASDGDKAFLKVVHHSDAYYQVPEERVCVCVGVQSNEEGKGRPGGKCGSRPLHRDIAAPSGVQASLQSLNPKAITT